MRILLLSALLAMTACEKEDKEEDTTLPDAMEENTSGLYRVGTTWMDNGGEHTYSGMANRRLRADGTYVLDIKDFTLTARGIDIFKDCTLYESGDMSEDGVPSNVTSIVIAGECGQEPGETILSEPSAISAFTRESGADIVVNLDVTYDDNGTEASDTLNLLLVRHEVDVWDGEGTDPFFLTTWDLKKMYRKTSSTCSGETELAAVTIEGRQTMTFEDGSYDRTSVGFGTGGTKCTASDSGSIEVEQFSVTLNQDKSTNVCAESFIETDVVARRDQVEADSFVYLSYVEQTSDDPDCPGSLLRTHTVRQYDRIH